MVYNKKLNFNRIMPELTVSERLFALIVHFECFYDDKSWFSFECFTP